MQSLSDFEMSLIIDMYHLDNGLEKVKTFYLTDFKATKEHTAFGFVKQSIIDDFSFTRLYMYLSLIHKEKKELSQRIVQYVVKTKNHLSMIEFYQKYIGTIGSSEEIHAAGMGLLDRKRGIKVEFVEGMVQITED